MPGGFLKEFYNKGTGERGGLNPGTGDRSLSLAYLGVH